MLPEYGETISDAIEERCDMAQQSDRPDEAERSSWWSSRLVKILLGGVALVLAIVIAGMWYLLRDDITDRDDLAQYSTSPSEFIDLPSGASAHYRSYGDPINPTVLLVHGGYMSLHLWDSWVEGSPTWVEGLEGQYHVVTVDMPGHGLTGRIPSESYRREDMVAFLKEFTTEIGVSDFVIAGHSMGGNIATTYTLTHPDDVAGLVVVAGGGIVPDTGIDDSKVNPPAENALEAFFQRWVSNADLTTSGFRDMATDPEVVTDDLGQTYTDLHRYDGNRESLLKNWREWADPAADLTPRLGEISVPTLIMWGSVDTIAPLTFFEAYRDGIPGSQTVLYDGVKHLTNLEAPEESLADMQAFTAEVFGE